MEGISVQRVMINVNDLNLFYRDTRSDKPPMLCLHGMWGRGETWTDLVVRYGDRFRIIAPDQRGHGLSDGPVALYRGHDMAGDAHALLQTLGCGPTIVVGHSMGGKVAAHLAALYPQVVKAVAILDSSAQGPDTVSDLPPEKVVANDGLTHEWPTPYATYDQAVQDLAGRFGETGVRYFMDSLVETIEGYDYMFSRYAIAAIVEYSQDWHALLPQIQCPVLFVRAADSWCLSEKEADKMRELIQDCTYFQVTGSDHMVYADNPGQFYPQFEAFLDRVNGLSSP